MNICRNCGIKVECNPNGFCSTECEVQHKLNYGKPFPLNGE